MSKSKMMNRLIYPHSTDAWYSVFYDKRWKGKVFTHDGFAGGRWIDDISKLDMNFYEIMGIEGVDND
jgi:hypothetical protein